MTVKTINVEPHWPGMLRWLEHVATGELGEKPDAVAITGGEDTAMYAIHGETVTIFEGGKLWVTGWEPGQILDRAYCTKVGDAITVAGKEVK